MGDITSNCTFDTWTSGSKKVVWVETYNEADSDDTFTVILQNYGITTIEAITGYQHTTEDSVITEEAPTTSVSSGTLTVTVGGSSNDDKKRVYRIVGDSK